MVVGARRPVAELGAMSPVRGLGNVLIGSAFAVLIGPGTGDLLSGYRVFGRRFREVVRPRSTGFEIEAELSGQAVARGLRVVEVAVPYHPRIAGTASKLRAFRDGCADPRRRSSGQGLRFRPWRPLLVLAAPVALVGLALGSWPVVLVGRDPGWSRRSPRRPGSSPTREPDRRSGRSRAVRAPGRPGRLD